MTFDHEIPRRSIIVGASLLVAGCAGNGDDGESGDDGGGDEADGGDAGDSGESNGEDAESEDPDAVDEPEPDDEPSEPDESEGDLELTSPAFDDGEPIPDRYGYEEDNVNPPLEIDGVPADAESLALVMDDPDAEAVAGEVWDHWLVWNVPPETTSIPEDWDAAEATEGTNDFDEVGYGGPSPPEGTHRYRFRLFALDSELVLPAESDRETLESAIDGRILEQARLSGTYSA